MNSKPASSAVYSAYFIMKMLMEAGLPPGVINFVPGSGRQVGDPVVASPELAGIRAEAPDEGTLIVRRPDGEVCRLAVGPRPPRVVRQGRRMRASSVAVLDQPLEIGRDCHRLECTDVRASGVALR